MKPYKIIIILVSIILLFLLVGKKLYIDAIAFATNDCSWYKKVSKGQNEYTSYTKKYIYCKVENLLSSPADAKYDYVSDINFNGLSYSKFPYLECLPDLILSDYQRQECKNPSKRHFIDKFKYPDLKLSKVLDTNNIYQVKMEDEDSCTDSFRLGRLFSIEGYRDVNNDGYMDIIMVITELTEDKTTLTMSPVVLSRYENGNLFVIK